MEKVLEQGKGVFVLVPEIALTPQLLCRFSARFPGQVAVLHSDLTEKERYEQWEKLRRGEARIVIGARSAIFAPVRDLGLIVVDEEHEGSFKQEESLRYHGRDVAVVRGSMMGARVVLGSATPSLESYSNAQGGKYRYVRMAHRVESRPMPRTTFVDLKNKDLWHSDKVPWLTRPLLARVERALREKVQCLLYLNRLGFAHFLFCRDCGHTWRCKNCDVSLTYYRNPPSLKCHYCGVDKSPPTVCEECQGTNLDTMGFGTEQVEKELVRIFPEARIARFDRSVIKTRTDLEAILNTINRREVDIVVGTQMIAKGHDFPGIALVGILVADSSLNLPDFRAHEKTFQVITQVSGRAGRAETPGEVVVQTINPEHPVLVAASAHKGEDFYRSELETRKQFGFPPYQRLAMLRFQHSHLKKVEAFAYEMVNYVQMRVHHRQARCTILGPSEAPLSRLKNVYRWQCLLKAESVKDLQSVLHGLREHAAKSKSTVRLDIDVDPISSM
jgi:primosomal protein N' (replication factor Y)